MWFILCKCCGHRRTGRHFTGGVGKFAYNVAFCSVSMVSSTCILIRLILQFGNNVLYTTPRGAVIRQILQLHCLLTQGGEVPCVLRSPRQETLR